MATAKRRARRSTRAPSLSRQRVDPDRSRLGTRLVPSPLFATSSKGAPAGRRLGVFWRSISIVCLTARARVRRLARVRGGCGRPGPAVASGRRRGAGLPVRRRASAAVRSVTPLRAHSRSDRLWTSIARCASLCGLTGRLGYRCGRWVARLSPGRGVRQRRTIARLGRARSRSRSRSRPWRGRAAATRL